MSVQHRRKGVLRSDGSVVEDFSETLSEIIIDNIEFRITWHPIEMDSCILWIKDRNLGGYFSALGRFTHFDKRRIIEFVARYTTSTDLRKHISKCIFERKVRDITTTYLENLVSLNHSEKIRAFKSLYDLDSEIEIDDLEWKRRVMAMRFHPDSGGDEASMKVINEAFDLLKESTRSNKKK